MFLLIALAMLGAWVIGRTVSDRWYWSQFLSWLPSPIVAAASALAFCAAFITSRLCGPMPVRRPAARTLAVAAGLWLAVFTYAFVAEWHGLRYLRPPAPAPGPGFSTLFYNAETVAAAHLL